VIAVVALSTGTVEIRCPDCGRLLLRVVKPIKAAEAFCSRCKKPWTFSSTGEVERLEGTRIAQK
jgi:phage FluMu protein Com